MRVLLWNSKTSLYFESMDSWNTKADSTHDFGNSLKAALFAQEHQLDGAEVYLDFGDHEYNVHLPVQGPLKQA